MISKQLFSKQYKLPADLVKLLDSRGLFMNDKRKAEYYLRNISYYRLTAYMHPFFIVPKTLHQFKPGTSFEKVLSLYRFDKKLRMLIFNEIEKIEVAFKCALINVGCEETGDPFWMTDQTNFISPKKFKRTMDLINNELSHSNEEFVEHFRTTYSNPYPPAWILTEVIPLGVAYNIYSNIKNKMIKKRISKAFGLQMKPFESWMTVIHLTRNACCHNARVWNKQNTSVPSEPSTISLPWITLPTDRLRIYYDLCIIKFLLNIISPNNDMKEKVITLLSQFPKVDIRIMGFPDNWELEPVWQ